ncbi:hypothetical protein GOODEAATRI_010536 [Goodea atripinnis]|uniref:Uncharacterized protein n=1 Tax=Goodea atripinnis TaxID=208336 RepID=A0ABV0PD02_9TELE
MANSSLAKAFVFFSLQAETSSFQIPTKQPLEHHSDTAMFHCTPNALFSRCFILPHPDTPHPSVHPCIYAFIGTAFICIHLFAYFYFCWQTGVVSNCSSRLVASGVPRPQLVCEDFYSGG